MQGNIRALEFYSGIGGMHYALRLAAPGAVVLDAFDINHAANQCYAHNFGKHPRQVDLERMSAKELDAYGADLWLLAPPCQPFTRQGLQLGAQDNRSRSFLNLLDQIRSMQRPPSSLLLENVVGFETSDMHSLLTECLAAANYHMQEFILTPTQYGIPYSRPRYFCLASKRPFPVPLPASSQPCQCTPGLLLQLQQEQVAQQTLAAAAQQQLGSHIAYVQPIGEYLWSREQQAQQAAATLQQPLSSWQSPCQIPATAGGACCSNQSASKMVSSSSSAQQQQPGAAPTASAKGQQAAGDPYAAAWVPDSVLESHAEVIDVVTAASRSCNCFTKAYGHFARGTGSLLATVADPAAVDQRWQLVGGAGSLVYEGYTSASTGSSTNGNDAVCHEGGLAGGSGTCLPGAAAAAAAVAACQASPPMLATDKESLAAAWKRLQIRYFTPQEIACLHSFPGSFSFPSDMASRQCYKLLGNSLSVAVVADLLTYLFSGFDDMQGVVVP